MSKYILYILPLLLLTMCDGAQQKEYALASDEGEVVNGIMVTANQSSSLETLERKLIKNGDLIFETPDVKQTKAVVEAICKELNAYIANESQNDFETRIQYAQTIRVPADKFDML